MGSVRDGGGGLFRRELSLRKKSNGRLTSVARRSLSRKGARQRGKEALPAVETTKRNKDVQEKRKRVGKKKVNDRVVKGHGE